MSAIIYLRSIFFRGGAGGIAATSRYSVIAAFQLFSSALSLTKQHCYLSILVPPLSDLRSITETLDFFRLFSFFNNAYNFKAAILDMHSRCVYPLPV